MCLLMMRRRGRRATTTTTTASPLLHIVLMCNADYGHRKPYLSALSAHNTHRAPYVSRSRLPLFSARWILWKLHIGEGGVKTGALGGKFLYCIEGAYKIP